MLGFFAFLLALPGALFAPVLHEYVKAKVAHSLGDATIRKQSLHTFGFKKFFEPIGFIFMLTFNVGWGQPVQVSPYYFKDKRKGILLAYLVPVLANLAAGIGAVLLWRWLHPLAAGLQPGAFVLIELGVLLFARCNVGLALFALLPVSPMAGYRVLPLFLSPDAASRLSYYEKPAQAILILMLIFGVVQMLLFPLRDALIMLAGS